MIIRGESLMLFVKDNSKYVSIAYATNHTLNINLSQNETSNKDQGVGEWTTFEAGVFSWDISSDNLFGDEDSQGKTYEDMVDLMLSKTQIDVVFGIRKDIASTEDYEVPTGGWNPVDSKQPYYTGKAIITSISLNAPNGDNASYTVSLQGCGALKKKTA